VQIETFHFDANIVGSGKWQNRSATYSCTLKASYKLHVFVYSRKRSCC